MVALRAPPSTGAAEVCTVRPTLQVDGVKQLSLEVPTATAEDAQALQALLLQTALEQELLLTTPLRVVTAAHNRLINFVTK